MTLTRRKALAALTTPVLLGGTIVPATAAVGEMTPHLPKTGRILFQGDSITDGGRGRGADLNHVFGQDYTYLIAARCSAYYPVQDWTFFNRGVSGNKVTDLAARWQQDTLDLKPDLLSMLIGVNDASSVIDAFPASVTVQQYEQVYDALLAQTKTALPNVKFVLCAPFVLPIGKVKERWEMYSKDVQERQEIVRRLADKYHAPFVRFQDVFAKACKSAPAEHWIWDGIHPTAAGHQLMADAWLDAVNAGY